MTSLHEVFGVGQSELKSYVERPEVDRDFQKALRLEHHIFVYGVSKQGKSTLRRKYLADQKCVVVLCRSTLTLTDLYVLIAESLHLEIPKEVTRRAGKQSGKSGKGNVGGKVIGLVDIGVEGEVSAASSDEWEEVSEPITHDNDKLIYAVAKELHRTGKRCVIENFHYLPERFKPQFAQDLRLFADSKAFFVVLGVWLEQNSLTYYQGDLEDHFDSINVEWEVPELRKVLEAGERALNIQIDEEVKEEMIADAQRNVGLLQRIAYEFCDGCGIDKASRGSVKKLTKKEHQVDLDAARAKICREYAPRYRRFKEAAERGFVRQDNTVFHVIPRIYHVFINATSEELIQGIPIAVLSERIKDHPDFKHASKMQRSSVDGVLNNAVLRINNLQEAAQISPIIMSYNDIEHKLQLVDQRLLFYRNYGTGD